jgi:tetratricopeptide (TPR) repeat protein/DNA-binding XRE family transcriptional regulator
VAFEEENEGSFGELLARYRTQSRISREKFAACLQVHRNTVIKWEQGDSLPKDRARIEEIVRCLNLRDTQRDALFKAALLPIPQITHNLPYPRNPFFSGRDQELEQLLVLLQHKQAASIGQTQSISGLGGVGKTQLAIEYAYRHQDEYQYVLWAEAENAEVLVASFTEIAHLLNLPEKDVQEQAITVQALKRWLKQHRNWLLILDNVNRPDLLSDFLPSTVGGHLLITTRHADLSTSLPSLAHSLVVDPFSDEQGALFLLHRSGLLALDATIDRVEADMQQLALSITHEMGGLPLALDQAGAYLNATKSSLAIYQQLYQQRRTQLLQERRGADADHPEPVATTWNISFRTIEQQNPAAADLLRFCASLAPDAIPEEILIKGAEKLGSRLASVVADAYLFNEAIEVLRIYSLITRDPHVQALSIHRLVQVVLRDSMSSETQQKWAECAVLALNTAFPDTDFANWSICERMLPHALICTTWLKQARKASPEAADLFHQVGGYLYQRARYEEAEPLLQLTLTIREQLLRANHPIIATSLSNLALLYSAKGKYVQAELLNQRALAIREQSLGPIHPDTALSLNNLACLYYDLEKYEKAESLWKRALEIWEQIQGLSHSDAAEVLSNLAHLYADQGEYVEAEPFARRALAIYEQVRGPEHPDTASSLNALANIYWGQRKDAEAELLVLRELEIRKQTLGLMHDKTALSLNSLAVLYTEQGKYAKAELLAQQALEIYEQVLGPTHPDTGTGLTKLAEIYLSQEKYAQAEPLYLRALSIFEQTPERIYPTTLIKSLHDLADIYRKQGKYTEAELLALRALEICEQELSQTSLQTGMILNLLAILYQEQDKYEEAEPLALRALEIYEQHVGRNHPNTAAVLNTLAKLYWRQERYSEAEPLYLRALEVNEQQMGRDHPTAHIIRKNYILLLQTLGRNEEATMLDNQENREDVS